MPGGKDLEDCTSSIESHAPSACKVVLLEASLIHQLLSEDIATAKQHLQTPIRSGAFICQGGRASIDAGSYSTGDAGSENGPLGQLALVPKVGKGSVIVYRGKPA